MKLAEALQVRKDLQIKVDRLRFRITSNCTVQEGEEPSENPKELLEELDRSCAELEDIISKINIANAVVKIGELTLTELISKRQILNKKISILRSAIDSASEIADRVYKTDIKILPTISVKDTQKEVDRLSKELRETELLIQESNWTTELV
ncbi:DIP1984 family protein [Lagierella sp.]|uniref:DIP1984 family protein n=1 Tax=Lagierella sp. TaxID=2849657 RepID=UPI00260B3F68|nr:DIP1984 family protein [Lagierella sp.]